MTVTTSTKPLILSIHDHAGQGDMLEVMLPGGEVVAATLVRHATGKIIPLVLASHH